MRYLLCSLRAQSYFLGVSTWRLGRQFPRLIVEARTLLLHRFGGAKMHIVVCVKQTPDSTSVYIDPISGQVDEERFVQILNPADACAVEAAVRLKEHLGGKVTALTVGPRDAEGTLRASLALGADSAQASAGLRI